MIFRTLYKIFLVFSIFATVWAAEPLGVPADRADALVGAWRPMKVIGKGREMDLSDKGWSLYFYADGAGCQHEKRDEISLIWGAGADGQFVMREQYEGHFGPGLLGKWKVVDGQFHFHGWEVHEDGEVNTEEEELMLIIFEAVQEPVPREKHLVSLKGTVPPLGKPEVPRVEKPWLGVFSNEESGFKVLSLMVDQSGFAIFKTPVQVAVGTWTFDEPSSVLTFEPFSVEEEGRRSMQLYMDKQTRSYIPMHPDTGKPVDESKPFVFQKQGRIPPEQVELYKKIPEQIEKERRQIAARKRHFQLREEKLEREKPEVERYIRSIQTDPEIILLEKFHVRESTPAKRALEAALRDVQIKIPESVLIQLMEKIPADHFWTRRMVLAREELSSETLEKYYPQALAWGRELSYDVLIAFLNNPNTPTALVEDLAKKLDVPVGATRRAQAKVRGIMEELLEGDLDVSRQEIDHIFEYAMTFFNRKDSQGRGEAGLLIALAKSRHTPSDVLHTLSSLENMLLQLAVLLNPGTLPQTIQGMTTSPYREVKVTLCEKPDTPEELLIKLSKDQDPVVRAAVASDPLTPVSLLLHLGDDESYSVKIALIKNENTPRSIIEKLRNDKNQIIKNEAYQVLRGYSR